MGLISGILGLPLAPLRGVVAAAEQIRRQAEEEFYDPVGSAAARGGRAPEGRRRPDRRRSNDVGGRARRATDGRARPSRKGAVMAESTSRVVQHQEGRATKQEAPPRRAATKKATPRRAPPRRAPPSRRARRRGRDGVRARAQRCQGEARPRPGQPGGRAGRRRAARADRQGRRGRHRARDAPTTAGPSRSRSSRCAASRTPPTCWRSTRSTTDKQGSLLGYRRLRRYARGVPGED